MATDEDVQRRIEELAEEEHALREREARETLPDADRRRLAEVEVLRDQAWDLLRQRRARREAGQDPDEAQPRPIDTVEGYLS